MLTLYLKTEHFIKLRLGGAHIRKWLGSQFELPRPRFVAVSGPCHYLNQCWLIADNWTLRNLNWCRLFLSRKWFLKRSLQNFNYCIQVSPTITVLSTVAPDRRPIQGLVAIIKISQIINSIGLSSWCHHQIEDIFRVTGHLCGEFSDHRWPPPPPPPPPPQRPAVTRSFDIFSDLCLN